MDDPFHKLYNVDVFLEKAKEMSELNQPDLVLFSECMWGAANVCIKTFFLENFKTLLMNHGDIRNFMDVVNDESYSDDPNRQKLRMAFENAEKCHKNFYELNFIDEDERNKYIKSVKDMKKSFSKVNKDTMKKIREILWPIGEKDSHGKQFSNLTRELPNESTVAFGITYKYLSKSYT